VLGILREVASSIIIRLSYHTPPGANKGKVSHLGGEFTNAQPPRMSGHSQLAELNYYHNPMAMAEPSGNITRAERQNLKTNVKNRTD